MNCALFQVANDHIVKHGKTYFVFLLTIATFFTFSNGVLAGGDSNLGGIAETLSGQTGALYDLALKAALLAGIVLVVLGFIKLNSQKQQQQGIGGAVALIAVGFMLVSIGAVVNYGSATFFGESSTGAGELQGLIGDGS